MDNNNWQILLDVLLQQSQSRLQNIKNTDPISFCLDNRGIKEILTKYINDFLQFRNNCKEGKDAKISDEKRKQGNQELKSKNLKESLDLYTESVFYAPRDEECLALAYANRSLVLYQLDRFEECLRDIELAFKHGYPVSSSAKLWLRMGRCLVRSGKIEAAEAVFKETLGNINKRCRDDIDSYKKLFGQEMLEVSKIEKNVGSSRNKEFILPEPKDGENTGFVSASNSLTVVYSKTKGRHVRAQSDIKIGDVLFVEKPFALLTLKEACDNCCEEIIAPIPCWHCLEGKYCSEECRDKSWDEFHKYECGFGELLKSVGIAHLALRVALAAAPTFNQFKKLLKKIKNKQIMEDESIVELKAVGYENVYNLVTNMSALEAGNLFQFALTSSLLSIFLQQHTNYFSGQDEKNLKRFATVVLRHICQLVCNGHAIVSVRNLNDLDLVPSQVEERIGTAIYPSASMMNHSCDPSIVNSFHKNVLIVRACKDIKKSQEVYNCYGPHCRRMKRAERQEILFSQYRFKCNCSACTASTDIQDIYTALRCEKCKGPSIRLSTEVTKMLEVLKFAKSSEKHATSSVCVACGHYVNISKELIEKETEIENLLSEGQNLLSADENASLALDKLLTSWRLGRQVLYKFHKNINLAADLVAKCLLLLGEYRRCIMFLKCTVLSVEARFGSTSIELATELKKLADSVAIYLSSNKFRDFNEEKDSRHAVEAAVLAYKRAETIYSLLCNSNHPCLVEIGSALNSLKTLN